MTFEYILSEKTKAMKAGDKTRVKVLNDIIGLVQKEQTKGKIKVDATEEMVATCPTIADYAERLADYTAQLTIAKEYAPVIITDEAKIKAMILDTLNNEYGLEKKNKGIIMKTVMPVLKGKVDMAVANKVIGDMLK